MYSKIKVFAAFLTVLSIFSGKLPGQTNFYDPTVIHEVKLYFAQPNWDYILDSLFTAGQQERLIGSVCIDGTCLDSVAVRYKGYSSVNVNFRKNPLNIDLNATIPDQEYMGVVKLKLGNVIHDPSFVREVLSYEIAREYMPAPQANYANVYINDTLVGLYTSIESVNSAFAERYFGSGVNAFFKGDPAQLEYPLGSNANLQYYSNDTTAYYPYYAMESDNGWADLLDLINILNNNTDSIENVLNVDRTLWMLAFDYALVNLDSYIAYAQNYYIYKDDYGRFNPVVWDLNMSFGSFRNSDASTHAVGGLTITQAKNLSPLSLLTYCATPRPLVTKLLANQTYKRMFLAHIRTIIQEKFINNWYYTRAQELQAIADASVLNDTCKFYTYDQFHLNIDTTVTSSLSYPGLRDFMTARNTYLSGFTGFQGAPVIDSVSADNLQPSTSEWVWFNAYVTGHDSLFFAYRYSAGGPFIKISMYDDGLHHDGVAGDNMFGVQVQMNGSLFQYYYYAENSTSGVFSPVRAENEFYSVNPLIPGSAIVINEFMADNESYAMDNYYENDDWIELYNNSDSAVSLSGIFLSDNIASLNKWAFPDTVLNPYGYLIVWADMQEWQSGLHANFKLSATGEELYLSYGGITIIDSVSFGQQTLDWSWGRYPNGTGPFGLMQASISAVNNPTMSAETEGFLNTIIVYPNPAIESFVCRWTSEKETVINLVNIHGAVVYEGRYESFNGGEVRINTSELPRGMYFVKVAQGGKCSVKKLILQ